MTAKTDHELVADLAGALKATGGLRVWSLIVTFFGDAVLPRGGRVGAAAIADLMSAMGLEDGAVRTALSRLAKERYLLREKEGRLAFYRLERQREQDFAEAARRIYAAPVDLPPGDIWQGGFELCVIQPPLDCAQVERETVATVANGLLLPSGVILAPLPGIFDKARLADHHCLVVEGSVAHLPEWVAGNVANSKYTPFADLERAIMAAKLNDPLACAALSCLLIHQWRRALLPTVQRHPHLQVLTGEAAARAGVARAYEHIRPLASQWFDTAIGRSISDGTAGNKRWC